jgi:hypothetical protein
MIALSAALLRAFASDRGALALAFVAPIAFFALFAAFFRHLDDPNGMRIEVALMVSSTEPAATRLANAIEARSSGRIVVTRAADPVPIRAIDRASAVITIPRDFDPDHPAVEIESLLPLPGTGDAVAQLVAAAGAAGNDADGLQMPPIAVRDHTRHGALMRAAAPGIPVLFMLFALSSLAARGLGDDEAGLGERLRSLGVSSTARMLAQFAALTVIALSQLVATLAFAAIAFGLVPASPLGLAGAAVAGAASCAAFVVALSEACGNRARFTAIAPVFTLVLAGLGGSMVPTVLLPEALASPSRLIFTGWSIEACVRAIDGRSAPVELLSLAVFTAACLSVAALFVRRSQFQ